MWRVLQWPERCAETNICSYLYVLFMTGLTTEVLHAARQRKAQEFLNHVKSLPLATDVNQRLSNGSTLVNTQIVIVSYHICWESKLTCHL